MLRMKPAGSRLRLKSAGTALALLALGIGGVTVAAVATGAQAARTLCGYNVAPVSGGLYTVQNNWWATAPACVATDGGSDFTVVNSSVANKSAPGGFPSIFMGCHWGDCTRGGLAKNPLLLSGISAGSVTSDWAFTPSGVSADVYDAAYDIWINQTPTTTGHPNGTEIMVWLEHSGPPVPAGTVVASGVWIGGYQYNIWYKPGDGTSDVITYEMTSQCSSVTNLDLGGLINDVENRGYTNPAWYLIAVEAGFELWHGGTGLATTSFAVNLTTPAPSKAPTGRRMIGSPVSHG